MQRARLASDGMELFQENLSTISRLTSWLIEAKDEYFRKHNNGSSPVAISRGESRDNACQWIVVYYQDNSTIEPYLAEETCGFQALVIDSCKVKYAGPFRTN